MEKHTHEKIKAEKPLDWQESAQLDLALSSQAPIKNLVSALEDPEPSLAWRSELNQKLLAVAKRKKRQTIVPWLGGLAAAAACTAAITVFVTHGHNNPNSGRNQPSFEAALAKAYSQTAEAVPSEEELAQTYDVTEGL